MNDASQKDVMTAWQLATTTRGLTSHRLILEYSVAPREDPTRKYHGYHLEDIISVTARRAATAGCLVLCCPELLRTPMKSYATATTIVVLSIFKFYEWYMNDTQGVILVRIEEPLD